ncbi:ABC transporter permease [Gryllotalpicola protaetiae]|uniref:ABC transporter permease n=1 Tax=Gryllotalpicola protaetiae TaxID=2419771 RepID=A0A387BT80_9MICO|nr:ABC transporter permease [Gryllotalpicola protaetiae]AYG04246.1 ABC transporter permease [Gryllotalpicola protaetiae]
MSETTPPTAPEPEQQASAAPAAPQPPAPSPVTSRGQQALRDIMGGSLVISVLAVFLALVVGAVLIAVTDPTVQQTAGYFFARPSDMLQAVWNAVGGAYRSLFEGAIYNTGRPDFAGGIQPLTNTLSAATPLIFGGLGIALAFRIGLFNIGGQGQILIGGAFAGWVAWSFPMPFPLALIVAILAGIVGGAFWAGIVGWLKAQTGAHEVIVTIMLNYVAFYLISFLLRTPGALQAAGTNNPKSPAIPEAAQLPGLFGIRYTVTWAFVLAIAAAFAYWWLMNRSNLGFRFRAVGENPSAARTAGIGVERMYIYGMAIAGGFVGLAGVNQVLATTPGGFSSGFDAGLGFDAITVALLGRSKPLGVFIAGLLFGALKSGGYVMQAANGIPIDIVLIVQSLIVLFIAAPPLVRAIFGLPKPGTASRRPRRAAKSVAKEA